jgi:hypothetical protein
MSLTRPPDFIIGPLSDPYLLRWWVIPRNRWFNIYLHKMLRDDDDRALHDHPWANVSVILQGGYVEHLPNRTKRRRPGSVVFRRAATPHRLSLLKANPADRDYAMRPSWSLFITGPVVRSWGFWCPNGWTHWRDFVSVREGGNERGKGCA